MFVVKEQSTLEESYIPRYFGHSNFSSFTRQLNFYGFRKVFPESVLRKATGKMPNSVDVTDKYVSFYHEYFKRGRPDLLQDIRRSSTKKTKSTSSSPQESELEELRRTVATLENRISVLTSEMNTKIAKLSSDFDVKLANMRKLVNAHDVDEISMSSISIPAGPVGGGPERKSFFSFGRQEIIVSKDDNKSTSSPSKGKGGGLGIDRVQLSPSVDSVIEAMSIPPKPTSKIGRLTTEEFFNGIFEENGGGDSSSEATAPRNANNSSHDISSTLLLLASQNGSSSRPRRSR